MVCIPRYLAPFAWCLLLSMIKTCAGTRLKFRAWDDLMGCFVHFGLRDSCGRVPLDIPDERIQQCIGLFDTEGNGIYEGDIVELCNSEWSLNPIRGRGEVVRCGDTLLVDSPCWGLHFLNGFHQSMLGSMKVVGNIFQHPEIVTDGMSDSDADGAGLGGDT